MNEAELVAGLAPTSNYRYADVLGNRLFIAGQVPVDSERRLVGADDVRAQTQQCLTNLFTLVTLHGFAREDIHQLTIYVVGEHQNLIDAWQQVTVSFDANVPPATLLGVTFLGHHGQLVEIDAHVERAS
jgi:enamine deaminase RidA (YjgF/YER057c/UK114 family)